MISNYEACLYAVGKLLFYLKFEPPLTSSGWFTLWMMLVRTSFQVEDCRLCRFLFVTGGVDKEKPLYTKAFKGMLSLGLFGFSFRYGFCKFSGLIMKGLWSGKGFTNSCCGGWCILTIGWTCQRKVLFKNTGRCSVSLSQTLFVFTCVMAVGKEGFTGLAIDGVRILCVLQLIFLSF